MKNTARIGSLALLLALTGCDGGDGPAATLSPALQKGEQIVTATCFACHGQGINGAPIIGNNKMWGKRVVQGRDVLVQHAINGYQLMPAKGGNTDLTDEEIGYAVDYMLSQLEAR
ncbi:c-type cytochrome [Neptuniibacter sp. CAU 1671]|uniref:c-type cytochrome n=1 Tax=Neptuniibacter sp. CAU 1671 TaxID=3032593 RepID=UPI0023DA057E|nr:c-type cytochrome [Neptuniibacter sp. CAU 1671]MDF2182469.1 c-type cytochrome [Neptuniibacter sp. CAU 1671]